MIKGILALTGKANQVFSLFALICEEYGDLTLGELARHSYSKNYWILGGMK